MGLRVLHLVGSPTNDFYADLSRLYADDCLTATADASRYETHIAYVSPDRRWRFPSDLDATTIAAAPSGTVAEAVEQLVALDLDIVVPQMFCLPGMTSYRALLDVLGLPYVGNAPDVMAIGANKARAKAVVAAGGVAVPRGEVLRAGGRPTLTPPTVVKPVDADNSLGVSLVRDRSEYGDALDAAFAHGDQAMVESYVELGREVRCGILERDGRLVGLPLEEYPVDDQTPIRGLEDKIRREGDDLHLVAKTAGRAWIVDPADPVTEPVWAAAKACHRAMGSRHYSLFDFRIDPSGQPWFLEAGLYCSFARQSVLSVMAAAAGISVAELFTTTIGQALET